MFPVVVVSLILALNAQISYPQRLYHPSQASYDCVSEYACNVMGANLLGYVNISSDDSYTTQEKIYHCQNRCQQHQDCQYFTYYGEKGAFPSTCYLYSACKTTNTACKECFSGPRDCSPSYRSCPAIETDFGGTWFCFPEIPSISDPVNHGSRCIFQCPEHITYHVCKDGIWSEPPGKKKCTCPPIGSYRDEEKDGKVVCWPPYDLNQPAHAGTYCIHACHGHPKHEFNCHHGKWSLDLDSLQCHVDRRMGYIEEVKDYELPQVSSLPPKPYYHKKPNYQHLNSKSHPYPSLPQNYYSQQQHYHHPKYRKYSYKVLENKTEESRYKYIAETMKKAHLFQPHPYLKPYETPEKYDDTDDNSDEVVESGGYMTAASDKAEPEKNPVIKDEDALTPSSAKVHYSSTTVKPNELSIMKIVEADNNAYVERTTGAAPLKKMKLLHQLNELMERIKIQQMMDLVSSKKDPQIENGEEIYEEEEEEEEREKGVLADTSNYLEEENSSDEIEYQPESEADTDLLRDHESTTAYYPENSSTETTTLSTSTTYSTESSTATSTETYSSTPPEYTSQSSSTEAKTSYASTTYQPTAESEVTTTATTSTPSSYQQIEKVTHSPKVFSYQSFNNHPVLINTHGDKKTDLPLPHLAEKIASSRTKPALHHYPIHNYEENHHVYHSSYKVLPKDKPLSSYKPGPGVHQPHEVHHSSYKVILGKHAPNSLPLHSDDYHTHRPGVQKLSEEEITTSYFPESHEMYHSSSTAVPRTETSSPYNLPHPHNVYHSSYKVVPNGNVPVPYSPTSNAAQDEIYHSSYKVSPESKHPSRDDIKHNAVPEKLPVHHQSQGENHHQTSETESYKEGQNFENNLSSHPDDASQAAHLMNLFDLSMETHADLKELSSSSANPFIQTASPQFHTTTHPTTIKPTGKGFDSFYGDREHTAFGTLYRNSLLNKKFKTVKKDHGHEEKQHSITFSNIKEPFMPVTQRSFLRFAKSEEKAGKVLLPNSKSKSVNQVPAKKHNKRRIVFISKKELLQSLSNQEKLEQSIILPRTKLNDLSSSIIIKDKLLEKFIQPPSTEKFPNFPDKHNSNNKHCRHPAPVVNGKFFCNNQTGINGTLAVGTNCFLSCNPGYATAGDELTVCGPNGAWISKNPLLCIESVALLIGGWNKDRKIMDNVEVYDPTGNCSNIEMAPLPEKRRGMIAEWIGGKVVVCGGVNETEHLNKCWHYDSFSNSWIEKRHSSIKERHFSAVTKVQNKLYVLGGRDGRERPMALGSIESFDGAKWTTERAINMTQERAYHCATTLHHENIVVTGGYSYNSVVGMAESLNLANNTWSEVGAGNLLEPRYLHGCCAVKVGDKEGILVAGGYSTKYLASTEYFDPHSNKWIRTGSLLQPRQGGQMTVLEGKPAILGGFHSMTTFPDTVEQFDIENQEWTVNEHRVKVPRRYFALVSVPRTMFKNLC